MFTATEAIHEVSVFILKRTITEIKERLDSSKNAIFSTKLSIQSGSANDLDKKIMFVVRPDYE